LYKIRCKWKNVIRRSSLWDCRLVESKAQISIGQTSKDYDGAVTAVWVGKWEVRQMSVGEHLTLLCWARISVELTWSRLKNNEP